MGSSSFTGNVSVVDEKLTSKTENIETLKSGTDILGTDIDSVSGNDAVDFHDKLATFVSIDNGIIKYSTEEISWKLRYERLQQCRLILFALDRQQTQYRQLRERLSKIGEGRIAKKEPVIDNICNVCSCPINIIDSKSFITCFVCNKRICHATKCSNFVPKSGRRECQICHFSKDSLTHTQSWITEQMCFSRQNHSYPVRARSEIYIPIKDYNEGSINFESVSQVGASSFAITADQKTKIREYVEEVVAKLLGNSLDQIRVTQLSKSENHLPGILNNHVIHPHPVGLNDNQTKENILTEFSEISQARLRNMVETIIAEMLGTSRLTNVNVSEPELNTNTYGNGHSQLSHRHRTEHPFEPKAYQDFLAKAVLNKIADNEGYIRKLSESTPDLSSCNIDINFNMDDRSNSPESSLETSSPFNYTDAQHSSKIIKDLDRESTINDYIASHTVPLPDLSAAMTDYEEDDMASVSSSILVEGNWEDNWLFRKKGPSLTTSITGSVGMLVPAPKDDVRAQIGDKTTDEISDLSEIDSDTDDSVQICAGLDPYNDRIINKHLIGGQNTRVILDELIETASLISNTSHSPNEANYIDTRNDHIVEKSLKTEAFNSKVANHSPLELKISSKSMPTNCYEAHTAQESENNPISGSIAEREYKKWNNAVEMPNNPYTPDALQRRISGSQERFIDLPNISSSTNKSVITVKADDDEENESTSNIGYKRYSRDYYINADNPPKVSPNHQNHRNDKRKRLSSGCSDELIEDTFTKEVNSYGKTTYKSIPLYSDQSDCHWIFSTPVRRSNSLECINHRSPQKSCYNFTPNATSTAPTYYKVLPRQPSSFTSASHYNNLDRIHMSKINHHNDSYKYSNRIYNKIRANENEYDIGRLDTNNKIDLDYCSDDKRSLRSWRSASVADNYSETLPSRRTLSSLSFYNNTNNTPLNSSNSKNLVLSNSNILSQFEKQLLHKDLKRNSFRAISVTTKDFVMNPLYEIENTTTASTDPNKNESKLNLLTEGVSDDQTDSGVDSFMHCFVATNTNADNTSFLN